MQLTAQDKDVAEFSEPGQELPVPLTRFCVCFPVSYGVAFLCSRILLDYPPRRSNELSNDETREPSQSVTIAMNSYQAWNGKFDAERPLVPTHQNQVSGSAVAPRSPMPSRQSSGLTEPDEASNIFEDTQERWVPEASRASSPMPAALAGKRKPPDSTYLQAGTRSRRPSNVDSRPPPVPPKVSLRSAATSFSSTSGQVVITDVTPSIHLDAATGGTLYLKKCEQCGEQGGDVWYCNICDTSFCDVCWKGQFVHRKAPRGGLPHEKTDVNIAKKVQNVLSPPTNDHIREQMYKADEITSWFGKYVRNTNGDSG